MKQLLVWWLLWNVLVPSSNWFARGGLILEETGRIGTIPGLMLSFVGLGVTMGFQLKAIQSTGCA